MIVRLQRRPMTCFIRLGACAVSLLGVGCGDSRAAEPSDPEALTARPVRIETLSGKVTSEAYAAVVFEVGGGPHALVLALRARDSFTCEDLGRQLREVRHALRGRDTPLILVTPASDSQAVRVWLRRERVSPTHWLILDPNHLLADRDSLATPALVLADGDGKILRGIAHPERVRNTRTRSFVHEMGLQ